MSGASFKAANISFKKRITFCRSIYVKKVMKLVALLVRGIVKQKCTDLIVADRKHASTYSDEVSSGLARMVQILKTPTFMKQYALDEKKSATDSPKSLGLNYIEKQNIHK